MSCKCRPDMVPVCQAGKCQCAKKSGADSKADTIRVMTKRLSGSVFELPVEGEGVVCRCVYFGQAIQYIVKHFSVCVESAKTYLRDLHDENHVEILPSFENPLYVVFEKIPVK